MHMPDQMKTELNSLRNAASPYLRQHAADPVDWRPWNSEAIAEAVQRDVPIFLSVGYAACHWCHVMQHEVFQNASIAQQMNANFVNIKVDREERPDIDEAYMLATQLLSGSGGWPMSVWLTPELKPFYAGTYFPPQDLQGRPGFPRLMDAISTAWRNNRRAVLEQADEIWHALEQAIRHTSIHHHIEPSELPTAVLDDAEKRFDPDHGGFRGRPKFPPHQILLLWTQLLEMSASGTSDFPPAITDRIRRAGPMLTLTLDSMQWGGIHDLVGGGFSRYSTDECWHVPHFEKMLYDNAQLAQIYARAALLLQRRDYAWTAERIIDFWLRDMSSTDGLLWSSMDADSEGHEGRYYTWTWLQLTEALADEPQLFDFARHVLDISPHGNWEGTHVLQLGAKGRGRADLWFDPRWPELMNRLESVRRQRPAPAVDEKIITAWNALMLSALSHAVRLENGGRFYDAGVRLLSALNNRLISSTGSVLRGTCGNNTLGPGFLDDYACLARGLMDWVANNPQNSEQTLALAGRIIDSALELFGGTAGELFTSADLHGSPLKQMRADLDNAAPSASAVLISAMLDIDHIQRTSRYADRARRALECILPITGSYPVGFATLLGALIRHPISYSTPQRATWHIASAHPLDHGGLRIVIAAHLPHPFKLMQVPEIRIQTKESPNVSASLPVQALEPTGESGERGDQVRHFTIDLPAPAPTGSRRNLLVHYTLCNDQLCLPEMHETLQV